jgi:hypothetical protein
VPSGHAWERRFWTGSCFYTVISTCRAGEHNGQTFGKQRLGLRVIRNDGKPVDIKTALVREGLVKTLPGLIGSVSALVRSTPDNVHVVQVSNAPEGLFVSVPTAYESLLASNPSEAAEHKRAGWRRATLSFS